VRVCPFTLWARVSPMQRAMTPEFRAERPWYSGVHSSQPSSRASTPVSGASRVQILAGVNNSPRMSPRQRPWTAPQVGRPHMQHHFGYGWGDGPNRGVEAFADGQRPWNLRKQEDLSPSPHPYMTPSQRLHGNVLDAGLQDSRPTRASRKPAAAYPGVRPHQAHFLSWANHSVFVHPKKHRFKPEVVSRHEVRGELPPTAQQLISAGSRPVFPTMGITAMVHCGR